MRSEVLRNVEANSVAINTAQSSREEFSHCCCKHLLRQPSYKDLPLNTKVSTIHPTLS